MAEGPLDVVGVGSALVDVLARTTDEVIAELGLTKGTMTLIDAGQAERLYDTIGPAVEASGGSCANTVAGLAALGSRTAFVGRVADDTWGRVFTHDIRALGVEFTPPPAAGLDDGLPTGRSFVLITPDAQRTMCTYLGTAPHLHPDALDPALFARARVTFAEGYLWDEPHSKAAVRRALELAREAGRATAFSLSDTFCVDRHRAEFTDLLAILDIVFANEAEARALFGTDDTEEAAARLAEAVPVTVVTRSERGSIVIVEGRRHDIPAEPVRPVDTTGAGDLYAAGFLHAWVRGSDPVTCGRLATACAARVIGEIGARPTGGLADLAAAHLP